MTSESKPALPQVQEAGDLVVSSVPIMVKDEEVTLF